MTAQPTWSPVDDTTADLLTLVRDEGHPSADHEWRIFVDAVSTVSGATGFVDQNEVRPLIRGKVAPRRIGSFYRRACLEGWLKPTERWVISDDTKGRNAGRPMRGYTFDREALTGVTDRDFGWIEHAMSDCPHGCKVYRHRDGLAPDRVIHNGAYGCERSTH